MQIFVKTLTSKTITIHHVMEFDMVVVDRKKCPGHARTSSATYTYACTDRDNYDYAVLLQLKVE